MVWVRYCGAGLVRRIIATVCFALGSVEALAGAQVPARDFAAWAVMVAAHQPGQRDEAVSALESWTQADVERLLHQIERLPLPDRVQMVSRALVLHADVALFNRTFTGYALPPGDADIVLYADGQYAGQMTGTFHWDFCRRLIERLPRGEARTTVARAFYRAAGAVLQLWGEHSELETHLRAGGRVLDDDAVLLMYEGTMQQALADPRWQRVFDAERQALRERLAPSVAGGARGLSAAGPVMVGDMPPTTVQALTAAERSLRRALARDPGLDEARVRLAHVLHERGRQADAARELARLPADHSSRFVAYYAAVVSGLVARARDRFDESSAAFTRTLAVEPRAQVPRIALAELALARGRRDAALQALAALEASAGQGGIDDPWWRVGRTHGMSARELIDRMARELQ